MTVEDMARAHLETVRNAINDLLKQKNTIDQEIAKLNEYVQIGEKIIIDTQQSVGGQNKIGSN